MEALVFFVALLIIGVCYTTHAAKETATHKAIREEFEKERTMENIEDLKKRERKLLEQVKTQAAKLAALTKEVEEYENLDLEASLEEQYADYADQQIAAARTEAFKQVAMAKQEADLKIETAKSKLQEKLDAETARIAEKEKEAEMKAKEIIAAAETYAKTLRELADSEMMKRKD